MNDPATILLVEDDDFAAIVVTEMLSAEYDLQHVSSGQAALKFLSQQLPDLVLLDVGMAGISGYDVCRAIRNDPASKDLPVIFLSGSDGDAVRLAGDAAGGDDCLTKPVSASALRSRIGFALASHSRCLRAEDRSCRRLP
ncbi:MAG: response regulator [Rhodocyclaceae bacterium]